MSVLTRLWTALAHSNLKSDSVAGPRLHDAPRAYFRVTDPQLAEFLRDWYRRSTEAKIEVESYLRRITPVVGAETPLYKVDEKGRVGSVNFQYAIGFLHDGWTGIPGTNWLVPESDQAKKDIAQLPLFPSHDDVNRAIGWPKADLKTLKNEDSHVNYERFALCAGRQTKISLRDGEVFVSVPYPGRFRDAPAYAQQVYDWTPPDSFKRIDESEGQRIEKRCDRAQSPLGRVLTQTLRLANNLIPDR